MLELRIIEGKRSLPIFDLPAMHGHAAAVREVGDTIEGLIAFLDELGGDPDLEPNGDELDGNGSEDDFMHHHAPAGGLSGPGCSIADPDCCPARDDDLSHGASDGLPGEPDDAEEDDEDTSVEDDPAGFDPETDRGVDDDGEEEDGTCGTFCDRDAHFAHRRRLQVTRCVQLIRERLSMRSDGQLAIRRERAGYRLWAEPEVASARAMIKSRRKFRLKAAPWNRQ